MTDVESSNRQPAGVAPTNPYSANPNVLPRYDPLNILKRLFYMGVSAYGLNHFNFYRVVLQSPHIRHEWFKIGLAATVGEFGRARGLRCLYLRHQVSFLRKRSSLIHGCTVRITQHFWG